jgi:hypothetical protein
MADARWTFRTAVDKYGKSPLEQDLRQANPLIYGIAAKIRPAPDLFSTGPLPPFVASGLPPDVLNALPAGCRHAAAAMSSPAEVYALLDRVAGSPDMFVPSAGLEDYQDRMASWAAGTDAQGVRVPITDPEDENALLDALLGEGAAGRMPPPPEDRVAAARERDAAAAAERVAAGDTDWQRYLDGLTQQVQP